MTPLPFVPGVRSRGWGKWLVGANVSNQDLGMPSQIVMAPFAQSFKVF